MDGQSLNITEERIQQLRQIFPDVFSEGKIDFNRLRAALGENVLFPGEHYELSWAGKADARREVQRQTTATLVPDLEGSVDFDNAQNIFIEGENLEVLRVLQKSYFGKVKMIYIDPPYNTGNDSFVYPDDFAERQEDYLKRTGAKDEAGFLNKQDLWKKNTKENGQFHSVWLSMMYPRLSLSRNLLKEDGLIFVSIDENEVANLKLLLNEIFGEENFVSQIVWQRHAGGGNDAKHFATDHEYIFCYAKNLDNIQRLRLPLDDKELSEFTQKDENFSKLGFYKTKSFYRMRHDDPRPGLQYNIECPDGTLLFGEWKWEQKTFLSAKKENKVIIRKDNKGAWAVEYKIYQKDEKSDDKQKVPRTLILDSKMRNSFGKSKLTHVLGTANVFNNPKPIELLKHLIRIGTEPEMQHIILDFFAGSGSTAHAILELNKEDEGNRQFICIQLPEPCEENTPAFTEGYQNIAQIALQRIKSVIYEDNNTNLGKLQFSPKKEIGLKLFKLGNTHFKNWQHELTGKDEILNQLSFTMEISKTSSALLMSYELALKLGLPLNCKIEKINFQSFEFYVIENSYLLLFESISLKAWEYIIELKPEKVVCLDSVFKNDDKLKANISLQLKENSIIFNSI